ncbi:MAG: serine protein kinase RIO [Nitrosospira sp.]|nr:serine protein kinase RIO [Nitrosospira sp.]MDW7642357.1 PA4780 family RIO1-like protein kinase [Nitrosomonadaceae bacterium]MBI0407976.1 serine protein kinase RIO [Nitrosospira sp.]MBI0414464.1 serine protein kinase RIO [Nitrosospira sp.]MBI0417202.1 serine protein kinase RIO [Nitrosospira sp.]
MKIPGRIEPLVREGFVSEVIRQLMSGKEATVYVVRCGTEICCAKVYKEANKRSFRQSVNYTEGRKTKNSRRARAIEKGTSYGRKAQEEAWQNAEVDALYQLAAAGVRVPKPYNFYEGVLLMELITDNEGNAAPRLNDLILTAELSREYHHALIVEVIRMLCTGMVHGDLSEYNVLVDSKGVVIIDFPQVINAAANNQARDMLLRDVNNLAIYFGRFAPELLSTNYGMEMWSLYQSNKLHPDSVLTGHFECIEKPVNLNGVMREINDTLKEERARQLYRTLNPR